MKKIILLTIALTCTFNLTAQEAIPNQPVKKFIFSGSVDTYFRQNINGPNGENAIAPNTAFANLNGFALGFANLIGSYKGEKVGAVADLVFGPRGEDATFLSPFLRPGGNSSIVNQLYVYWDVSDKVTVTLGNFNTFLGYELISPLGNFNYSTSYMFSYGPFSHTGIKVDYAISDTWSAMIGVFNNTDATEFNFDNDYTVGAQLGYKDTFLNLLYGKQGGSTEATFQVDLTTGANLGKKMYLGFNATYSDTDETAFYGIALYPQYTFSEKFSLGLRSELFGETEGGVGAIGAYDEDGSATVFDLTLTGSYTVGDLTIKPEIRLDSTSENSFVDTDLEPTNSLSSFLLAAIYKF